MPSETGKLHGSGPIPIFQVTVRGHLGRNWEDWFDGFTIAPQDNGNTCLTGQVLDQAALYALLRKVQDLGLPLVSVVQHTEER